MKIRLIEPADANDHLAFTQQLDNETSYMLMEPGERKPTANQHQHMVNEFIMKDRLVLFIVEDAGTVVGHAMGVGGSTIRNCRTASVVIGLLPAYHRLGIGKRLLRHLEAWAKERRLRRLELTVIEDNTGARALYEHFGFQEEGVKQDSLFAHGTYVNEIMMAKLL
ncbi:N-acetyltransferase [Marinococcus halophilus]|uniref:N-acetyltransferase n=1 Tax=Marinococcus halophilus TaxID=1371 RepID=A0A510Y7I9_MARHA|nr:GNAT family N-acetyltransferase [Marinococcus halophilus]OZT79830.1 N-acetyltransferase [Marinococcus halophilus]GEK58651.1 N-acetyltransferase [Marinococcus halophilus]